MNKLLLGILLFCTINISGQTEAQIDSLMKKAAYHLKKSEYTFSIATYNSVWRQIKNNPPSKNKVIVQNNLGVAYWKLGDYKSGIYSYQTSLEAAIELDNDTLVTQSRYNIGIFLKSLGNYKLATEHFLMAIEGFESLGETEHIARVYDALGNIHSALNHFKAAETYHYSALKIYKELKNLKGEARVYHNLSNVLMNSDKAKEGYQYLLKAKKIKKQLNLSCAKTNSRIGQYFLLENQLDSAEYYLKLSLAERKTKNNRPEIATSYWHLGRLSEVKKETDLALNYLKKARDIADSNEMNALLMDVISSEIEIRKKKKEYGEVVRLQEELIILNEIVLGEKSRKEVIQFDVKYGLLKKDQELNRTNNQLELGQIRQEKLTVTIIVLGLIGLLALSFIILLKRLNQKLKKQGIELINKNSVIENLHQELKHRTRNYYEMFSGMIQFEKRNTTNQNTTEVLEKYASRVEAMSQISNHLLLDNSQIMENVQLDKYLIKLLGHINLIMNNTLNSVQIQSSFERLNCDYNRAIRIGLVMNELLNNAFEHGLTNIDNPKIKILLTANDSTIRLKIEDNGVGINNVSIKNINSQGLSLMEMILDNIEGNLTYSSGDEEGTVAQVRIPYKKKGV